MKVEDGPIPGLRLIQPDTHADARGAFRETWHGARYAALGFPSFVQDNQVLSVRGVLRGLHFQHPNDQDKLVSVAVGEIFDVAVDVRTGSPTFGRHASFVLSADTGHQLFIPAGFAHGYLTLSDRAVVIYKCSTVYSPSDERTISWNDPALGIEWPLAAPLISDRDARALLLRDVPPLWLPRA